MNDLTWMEKAVQEAGEVYGTLLDDVVGKHVLHDREDVPLGQETRRKLEKGQIAQPNVIRLLTISGKGGYPEEGDNDKDRYAQYYNISLLDHLLSTVRGAVVFAALEWLSRNPDMDPVLLHRRLRVIAAVAFLHDLDKDLRLARNTPLTDDMVRDAMIRYGFDAFLGSAAASLEPDQMRYLIEKVEASQAHRHPPKTLPPRELESLPFFVRLADQLDSTWCLDDPLHGGLAGVLERIRTDESILGSNFLRSWKAVSLFDPHHPFLLDELQRSLSSASLRTAGVPPLIETHRDGELFMLLPEENADAIIEKAVKQLCARLPFNLRLSISNRGVPSLLDGRPSHEELADFMARGEGQKALPDLLKISASFRSDVERPLEEMLANFGLGPRWPKAAKTSFIRLYSTLDGMEEPSREILYEAGHLALLLSLGFETGSKKGTLTHLERERELLETVSKPCPEWISGMVIKDPDPSRRTLMALWATALAREERGLWDAVWGNAGLLKKWLEGDGTGKMGMRDFINGRGAQVSHGVERRLMQLLGGSRIAPEDESAQGRCLFTGEPAPFDEPIDQKLGLYEVKVSAFSGREGRPESLTSERAHTIVSAPSVAEHTWRSKVHEDLGGRQEGVPALVSSPTTSGLFGGLALKDGLAMQAMSIYDLSRLDFKKGRIINEAAIYQHRFRIARLERMPEKLSDQVDKLRLLIQACRRIGRPIHVFRGLPFPEKSYFYFDAMPEPIESLLGSKSLRLEQLPLVLKRLRTAQFLLDSSGLGYDTFRRYTNPSTRLGAICLAWCGLKNNEKTSREMLSDLVSQYRFYTEERDMSEQDGALVRFGQAAANIQQRPLPGASANEELLVFKIAMDAVTGARRMGQTDEASLINAVAGELETNLARKGKTWLTQSEALRKRCLQVAELFVRDVWLGVLKGKMPGQNNRRVMASIYRMAFVTSNRK